MSAIAGSLDAAKIVLSSAKLSYSHISVSLSDVTIEAAAEIVLSITMLAPELLGPDVVVI